MHKSFGIVGLMLCTALVVCAQTFSSGSTGADGVLDLTATDRIVQLPESGVLNYTTINIPSNRTLTFKRNSRNTPVTLLAQGNVIISGTIDISAPYEISSLNSFSEPGPGGFYGGQSGMLGFGPGGGTLNCASRLGKWVGPLSLIPLVGGSGGAGFSCNGDIALGGGGGGAILIASSSSISIGGTIRARGAEGPSLNSAGSGGAIRLVANSIGIFGSLNASTSGGNPGVIRLEAPTGSINPTGSNSPAAVVSDINPVLVAAAAPLLTIASVGGFAVPSYSGSSFNTVDLLLPMQLVDPINVVVLATNIPVGTQVNIGFVSGSSQGTSTPGTLSGTVQSSTATLTISNLHRTSVTYLLATASFDPPANAQHYNPKGSDHVAKIKIETKVGARPTFVFLRRDGTMIDQAKLPRAFLNQFGL